MGKQRSVRSVAVACLVLLGMVLGQATASLDKKCYRTCMLVCLIAPPTPSAACPEQCMRECTPQISLHLGCVLSLCSNISTEQNPEVEIVANCVDYCTKNIAPPPSWSDETPTPATPPLKTPFSAAVTSQRRPTL